MAVRNAAEALVHDPSDEPIQRPAVPLQFDAAVLARLKHFTAFYFDRAASIEAVGSQGEGETESQRRLQQALANPAMRALLDDAHQLLRDAVASDDWSPYAEHLRLLGERAARRVVPADGWPGALSAWRARVLDAALTGCSHDAAHLASVLHGLEHLTDLTLGALSDGYGRALNLQLRESTDRERLFAAVVDSSRDAIVSTTVDGTITGWNRAAERMYGFSAHEAIGANVAMLFPGTLQAELACLLERLSKGEVTDDLTTDQLTRAGRRFRAVLTISPVRDPQGRLLGGSLIARSIGQSARAKAPPNGTSTSGASTVTALTHDGPPPDAQPAGESNRGLPRDISTVLQLEARRAAMLDGALDAIITVDHERIVHEFNPAAERLFGYSASEAIGSDVVDLVVPPPQRQPARTGFARYMETRETRMLGRRVELDALHRSGRVFPAEVSVVQLKHVEPPMFTGFIRDLTSLNEAKAQLRQSIVDLRRSNEDLEQFAFVASHDLQEPLRMVTLFMSLFQDRYNGMLDEQADEFIGFAVDGARRMKGMVKALLSYSRVGTRGHPFQLCSCSAVLDAALRNLEVLIAESDAEVTRDELPELYADASQLERVFLNLIGNALKFRADRPPRIHIGARRRDRAWELSVQDNGIGFTSQQADRIFRLFQRLHERSKYGGTGIGLALTKRIIERHGGKVWATSEPGRGSTFYIQLPDPRSNAERSDDGGPTDQYEPRDTP